MPAPPRLRARDPLLDADLASWVGSDPARPRIGILGLVEIAAPGVVPKNRHRFYGGIVVYLAARGARGGRAARRRDLVRAGSHLQHPPLTISPARPGPARNWLGDTPVGDKWMPRWALTLERAWLADPQPVRGPALARRDAHRARRRARQ
jgi:hypothetical protein